MLDFDRLKGRPTSAKLRYDLLVKTFGQLGDLADLPPVAAILSDAEALPADFLAEWQRAVAEELLLRHNCGLPMPADWTAAWQDIPPFSDGQPLGRFLRYPGACAVFPLAGNPEPGVGHLWVFDAGKNGSNHLGGNPGFALPAGYWPVIEAEPREWLGQSCQLAAHLAAKALADAGAPNVIAELGRHWIVSGRVTPDGRIEKVEFGNKLQLAGQINRHWLLPADNRNDIPLVFRGRRGYRLAYDMESAWNQLTGRGVLRQAAGGWPAVSAFHSFTSGAREPVIAAALFTKTDRRNLWHTSNLISRTAAEDIVRIVQALDGTAVSLHPIDSADMALVERQLMERLEPDLDAGRSVLFNVTQGNRLMSFAVHSLARRYENLLMIYRDLDELLRSVFTLIRYEGGQPVTQSITGDETRLDIAWDCLFFKPTPREPEPWQKLLAKLRKNEGSGAL